MKTLTIHDIKPEFFKMNFHNYELTFDDGLYSQYFYWSIFNHIPVKKTLFIATNLIDVSGVGRRKKWKGKMKNFPTCFEALADFRATGNRENYMRIEELREIASHGVTIGAHGHNHIKNYKGVEDIKEDIEKMFEWFGKYLYVRPIEYAFPHYEQGLILHYLLKKYGIQKFYGRWRIEIEEEINLLSNV